MSGLVTALRTLTILPVPGKDAKDFSSSLYWFPLVGLLLGLILYGVVTIFEQLTVIVWPEGMAVLLVLLSAILTRGIHLDGLSDWADGFWGGQNREKILSIMKDSSIGTFGGTALIIFLLAKWICITRMLYTSDTEWIIGAFIISRSMQAILASSFPYARPDGGTAESFINNAGPRHRLTAVIIGEILVLVFCGVEMTSVIVFAAAWMLTVIFGRWSYKKIGGVTGDMLGAVSEITETITLAVGALLV